MNRSPREKGTQLYLIQHEASGFPLGARGERPVRFVVETADQSRRVSDALEIPGAVYRKRTGTIDCTFDAAPFVAAALGVECPPIPVEDNLSEAQLDAEISALPGLPEYADKFSGWLRGYQQLGALFLARRAYGMLVIPPRSGKTPTALAAATLVKARRVLVFAPAIFKRGWAEEIARRLGESALMLYGLSASEAAWLCVPCFGRGTVKGEKCLTCRGRGERAVVVRDRVGVAEGARGSRFCPWPESAFICSTHRDARSNVPGQCRVCAVELEAALEAARWVVLNYDLVLPLRTADKRGKVYARAGFEGWTQALCRTHFDAALLDECQAIRNWPTSLKERGLSRREHVVQILEPIERVWGMTATPRMGYVRDLAPQHHAISRGAITHGADTSSPPFNWQVAYCDAAKGKYGWEADGRSERATSELIPRARVFTFERSPADVAPDQPAIIRTVHRIESPEVVAAARRYLRTARGSSVRKRDALREATAEAKLPMVVENVVTELVTGMKVMVLAYNVKTAETAAKKLNAAIVEKSVAPRMREVRARVFCAVGTTPEQRFAMAAAVREHAGACVLATTYDSMQTGVNLAGIQSEHKIDLHHLWEATHQAEQRPNLPGALTMGLQINDYIVKDSIDEVLEASLEKHLTTSVVMGNATGASEMQSALRAEFAAETPDDMIARLTTHLGVDTSALDLLEAEDAS